MSSFSGALLMPGIKGNTAVSSNIEEWNAQANHNLSYMTFDKLNETFNCI